MVVGEFEYIVTQRIDPLVSAAILALHFRHTVRVMIVERIDPATRNLECYDIASLGPINRLNGNNLIPCATAIGAAHRDDMLAGVALLTGAGGDHAKPRTVVRLYDIGLVSIALTGDIPAVADVSRIGNHRCRRRRLGLQRSEAPGKQGEQQRTDAAPPRGGR